MKRIEGVGVSPGHATGPAVVFESRKVEPAADPAIALELVAEDLEALAGGLEGELGEILLAQVAIARDPELGAGASRAMGDGAGPAAALEAASRPFVEALAGARGEYQRQRAADLQEIVRRAIARIEGEVRGERRPPLPGILIGTRVSPADTASVPAGQLLGIVSVEGGERSHAAIVARSLGIPAVSGVDPAQLAELAPGDWLELDGGSGLVLPVAEADERRYAALQPAADSPASRRTSGADVRANLGTPAEAELAAANGVRSAGLVRTEFLLGSREALEVDRQTELYREMIEPLPGEIVFRLLDVGADKPHPAIDVVPSPNPALGIRGARLLLRQPALAENQLRALCRLGEPERVSVMVPMVTRVEELRLIRALAAPVFAEEGVTLPIGTMIEVPSAALAADELAAESAFLSIGTNDLIQYLFAADRTASELDDLVEPLPASFWRLLRSVFDAGREAGIAVGVCGELAADELGGGALTALGAGYLSVGPGAVEAVHTAIAARTGAEWAAVAAGLTEET